MRIFKDQVVNAICLFAFVFTFCLILSIVLKCFFEEEIDVPFVKDIFSIGATAFGGLVGVALYTDWKDQKQYDLEKQFAEKILNDLIGIDIFLKEFYYQFMILRSKIGKNLIVINNYDTTNNFNLENKLYNLTTNFEILNKLLNRNTIDEKSFKDLETHILLLEYSLNTLKSEYEKYYETIPINLKNKKPLELLSLDLMVPLSEEFRTIECNIYKYLKNTNEIQIQYNHKGIPKYFNYTLEQYFEIYKDMHMKFSNEITQILKTNKTAS